MKLTNTTTETGEIKMDTEKKQLELKQAVERHEVALWKAFEELTGHLGNKSALSRKVQTAWNAVFDLKNVLKWEASDDE